MRPIPPGASSGARDEGEKWRSSQRPEADGGGERNLPEEEDVDDLEASLNEASSRSRRAESNTTEASLPQQQPRGRRGCLVPPIELESCHLVLTVEPLLPRL
nr:unnamed protein product [Digitaria exilis]